MAYINKNKIYSMENDGYGFELFPSEFTHTIDLTIDNKPVEYFIINKDQSVEDRELNLFYKDVNLSGLTPFQKLSYKSNGVVIQEAYSSFKVKIIDFNLGINRDYAEIEFSDTVKDQFKRTFIKQKYLKPIKDFNFSRNLEQEYEKVKEKFKQNNQYNQIKDLNLENWESNFSIHPEQNDIEWIYKKSSVYRNFKALLNANYAKNGEIFFDKKRGFYCVSILTEKEKFNEITNPEKSDIVNFGRDIIFEYLKIPNGSYGGFTKVLDINIEQTIKKTKIKFLVGIAHRHIAEFINTNLLPGGAVEVTTDLAKAFLSKSSPETFKNLNEALLKTLPDDVKKVVIGVENFNLDSWTKNYINQGEILVDKWIQENPNLLTQFVNELKKGLFMDFLYPTKINEETPYIYFNFSKNGIEFSKEKLKALKDSISIIDKNFSEYSLQHDIEPPISWGSINNNLQNLFDQLYQYSLDKISSKALVSKSKAEELLSDCTIFLSDAINSTNSFWFGDLPGFFEVIGIQITYVKNPNATSSTEKYEKILVKEDKKQEFIGISGITNKTCLFLYYFIDSDDLQKNIIDIYINQNTTDGLPNNIDNFIKQFIFPRRKITWKPNPDDPNANKKCAENIVTNFKNDVASRTEKIRNSIFASAKNQSKMLDGEYWQNSLNKIAEDLNSTDIYNVIDLTALMIALVECLKAKNFPIELLAQIIEWIEKLLNNKGNWICMLPPLSLPEIPAINLDIELKTVDILGIIYKSIKTVLIDTINKLILEGIKLLLDLLLDCEGAFGDDIYNNYVKNTGLDFSSLASQNNKKNPDSSTQGSSNPSTPNNQPKIGKAQDNNLSEEISSTSSSFESTYGNPNLLKNALPFISFTEKNKIKIVAEFKKLMEIISTNLSTPQFLNLLSGNASRDVEWYIRDIIASDLEFTTLNESESFNDTQNFNSIFLSVGSLIDPEIINEARSIVIQVSTDINALCKDLNNLPNTKEISDFVEKFGNERIGQVKNKIYKKQIQTVSLLKLFLDPNQINNLIPPITSRLNSDGSITKGIIPDEPHPAEIFQAQSSIKVPFEILKKNFNEELKVLKYAFISSKAVEKKRDIEITKKMFPGVTDSTELTKRSIYFTEELTVHPYLQNILSNNYKKNGNVFTCKFNLPMPDTTIINDLISNKDGKFDGINLEEEKNRLITAKEKIIEVQAKFPDNLIFIDNFNKKADASNVISYFKLTHSKLGTFNFQSEEKLTTALKSILNNKTNTFADGETDILQKVFCKLLYSNNIIINKKRYDNITSNDIALNTLYKNIYNKFLEITNENDNTNDKSRNVLKQSQQSPIMKLSKVNSSKPNTPLPSGKPYILSIPFESYQTQFCLDNGYKDTHLLKTEEEKKIIIDYYKKFKWMDKPDPEDGSSNPDLDALQKASLYSYINMFFRIFVYDYYLRSICVYNYYKPVDTDNKLMEDFLYNCFKREKYFKKLEKITLDGKYIKEYYKYLSNLDGNLEDSYRFLIRKNIKLVTENLQKKLLKAKDENFIKLLPDSKQDGSNDPFNELFNRLPIININDDTKTFSYNTSEDYIFCKIEKNTNSFDKKYYMAVFTKYDQSIDIKTNNMSINKYTNSNGQNYNLTVISKINIDSKNNIEKDQNNDLFISSAKQLLRTNNEFTFITIAAICQTTELKDVEKIFNGTKLLTLRNMQYIINNGYDYLNTEKDQDKFAFEFSLFIKAALALPVVILKGVCEAIDPNIMLSSKISLGIKIIKELLGSLPPVDGFNPKEAAESIPEIKIPFISLPIGFTLPFIFTPLTIAYLLLCIELNDEQQSAMSKSSLISEDPTASCEIDPEL